VTFLSFQIKYGGVVPASFYLRDSVLVQYDSSVKVSRGSAFQLEVEVTEAGSLLRYYVYYVYL